MNERNLEKYQGYRIEAIRFPFPFAERSVGFGWNFSIYSDASNNRLSIVYFWAPMGPRTQENIDKAFELGKSRVHSLIDNGSFAGKRHCYRFEPDGSATEVDCDELLPKDAPRGTFPPLA